MAEVLPFRGIRYNEGEAGPLGNLLSPPYDVISEEQRLGLYRRAMHNIVRIEAGRDDPGDDEGINRYDRAQRSLKAWLECEVLRADDHAAFYIYDQEFDLGGERLKRRGFFGALRLYEAEKGVVLPHEHTFPKAKSDRLSLLRATRTNTSPVFGMFDDRGGEVGVLIEGLIGDGRARPAGEAIIEDEQHRLWAVDDPTLCAKITAHVADRTVYIADGHHRYETGLNYRNEQSGDGCRGTEHVLAFLCPLDDPGLRILATHRIMRGGRAALDAAVVRDFDSAVIDRGALGDTQPGIVLVRDGSFTELRPKATADLSKLPEEWRTLPVAQAELLLNPARDAGADIAYEHDTEIAIDAAVEGVDALLIRAVDPRTLQRVADAGERMPQKTTYFYPKVPTGLVLRSLDL